MVRVLTSSGTTGDFGDARRVLGLAADGVRRGPAASLSRFVAGVAFDVRRRFALAGSEVGVVVV